MREIKKYLSKKSIAVLVVVFGAVMLPAIGSEDDHSIMDLAYVRELVLEGNLDIKEAEQEISQARTVRIEADEKERDRGATKLETYKNRDYYPEKADIEYDYAVWSRDEVAQAVLVTAEENYMAHRLKEEEILLQISNIDILKTELQQIERKIELGRAVEYDRTKQALAVSQAEHALTLLYNERETLGWELKKLMNVSLDSNITFEDVPIPEVSYDAAKLEEAIADALETNGEIVKAEADYDLALVLVELTDDAGYDSRDSEYMTAMDGVDAAEINTMSAKLTVEYDIRSGYNALLNAMDAVQISVLASEQAKMSWDATQRRYELGLATELNARKAKQAYDESLHSVSQAKVDAYIENATFLNLFE